MEKKKKSLKLAKIPMKEISLSTDVQLEGEELGVKGLKMNPELKKARKKTDDTGKEIIKRMRIKKGY